MGLLGFASVVCCCRELEVKLSGGNTAVASLPEPSCFAQTQPSNLEP